MNISPNTDNLFYCIEIADLHFGAFDPKHAYEILQNQFLSIITQLPRIDCIAVLGDIFDHKMMSNSEGIYYASLFIDDLVNISVGYGCPLILIEGTYSHDANQLQLFYHYMRDENCDVRIVTQIQYEYAKNFKILCIPELYNIDEEVYQYYLHGNGWYDICFLHGTFKGAVYGDNVGNGRLFTPDDFLHCLGFMVGGHVHISGCYSKYFYYCGSPYRWKFGEEKDKGFLISVYDQSTRQHYVHFQKIECDTYITLDMSGTENQNPKDVIDKINHIRKQQNIDYLKMKFTRPVAPADRTVIESYFRNNPNIFVEFLSVMEEKQMEQRENGELPDEYNFILDPKLSDLEKFCQYVNLKEGSNFVTVDKLKDLLNDL